MGDEGLILSNIWLAVVFLTDNVIIQVICTIFALFYLIFYIISLKKEDLLKKEEKKNEWNTIY